MSDSTPVTQAVLARNPGLFASEIDDELVMMDEAQGLYFALNPVGRKIWSLLETPRTRAALLQELVAVYDVPAERCRADVEPFLEKMIRHGLVRVHPG